MNLTTKLIVDYTGDRPLWNQVTTELAALGKQPQDVFYRVFSPDRVEQVLAKGTDRERDSRVTYFNDEGRILRELRIDPNREAHHVLWVLPLNMLKAQGLATPFALSLYNGRDLEILNRITGFARFRQPFRALEALIGVVRTVKN